MTKQPTADPFERVWLTTADAARYCSVDRVSVYRARLRGTLRAGGAGRAVRFERSELDRWMRSGSGTIR